MAFNKPIKPATDINSVKRSAFWHLGRRDHSEQELRKKLSRKTDNQQWIEAVIGECYDYGYLDDNRFISSFMRIAQNKGYGLTRIGRELNNKGISTVQYTDHFLNDQFDYVESAYQLLQKRYHERIENAFLKQKVMLFLQSKGHSFEHIFTAIERHNEHFPIEDCDPVGDALSLLNSKFRTLIGDQKSQDKAKRFLISRGHNFTNCLAAIKRYNQQYNEEE